MSLLGSNIPAARLNTCIIIKNPEDTLPSGPELTIFTEYSRADQISAASLRMHMPIIDLLISRISITV